MARESRGHTRGPTPAQRRYLRGGLEQPGGKLPLFDEYGQEVSRRTVSVCVEHGWAEPWFSNPTKPNWMVCKLTEKGRKLAKGRTPIEARRVTTKSGRSQARTKQTSSA